MAARASSVLSKREALVARREVWTDRREQLAPQFNERALLVANEAARTMKMAVQLAALHLVENVAEQSAELVASAKYGAPPALNCGLDRR